MSVCVECGRAMDLAEAVHWECCAECRQGMSFKQRQQYRVRTWQDYQGEPGRVWRRERDHQACREAEALEWYEQWFDEDAEA